MGEAKNIWESLSILFYFDLIFSHFPQLELIIQDPIAMDLYFILVYLKFYLYFISFLLIIYFLLALIN